jgi:hypothetical protein
MGKVGKNVEKMGKYILTACKRAYSLDSNSAEALFIMARSVGS